MAEEKPNRKAIDGKEKVEKEQDSSGTLKGAIIGALITGIFSLMVAFGPKMLLKSNPDISLVSARWAEEKLDIILKNSGTLGAVATEIRIVVLGVKTDSPPVGIGGFLPISATYEKDRILNATATFPDTVVVPISQSLGKDTQDRFTIALNTNVVYPVVFETNVWAIVDGKDATNAQRVDIRFDTKDRMPSHKETLAFLSDFWKNLDEQKRADEYYSIESRFDPIAGKPEIVAVYKTTSQLPIKVTYSLMSIKSSSDVEYNLKAAVQELSNFSVEEYRSLHNFEDGERKLLTTAILDLESTSYEQLRQYISTVLPMLQTQLVRLKHEVAQLNVEIDRFGKMGRNERQDVQAQIQGLIVKIKNATDRFSGWSGLLLDAESRVFFAEKSVDLRLARLWMPKPLVKENYSSWVRQTKGELHRLTEDWALNIKHLKQLSTESLNL